MLLLLQNTGDRSATWLRQQLVIRGMDPVVITVDEILTSKNFTLELVDGQYTSCIELQNGRQIDSRAVQAVINRVNALPSLFKTTFKQEDAGYVYQEWQAILLSWLHSMRAAILFNQPTPTGLAGEQFNTQEWMLMAARAGLLVLPYEQSHAEGEKWYRPATATTATVSLICFDGDVFYEGQPANIPKAIKQAAISLQQAAGVPMIGVQLLAAQNNWYFAGATTNPVLLNGSTALADAITDRIMLKLQPNLQVL